MQHEATLYMKQLTTTQVLDYRQTLQRRHQELSTWILSSPDQSFFQEDLVPIWACIKKGEIETSFGRCNYAESCPAASPFL